MSAAILALHINILIEDPGGTSARRDPTQPLWGDRPIMLRQGDRLEPLVQAGVHEGRVFVETWSSLEQRLMRGDRQ
ncbi:MAG TPA: hypothetical protein DCL06_06275 [Corynebacterium variabile]|uniref:Uncharacterized protein n=1 Tax=Corynebacterium variabile TaxID=1727 RepID=A0A3B9QU63_9CORY|nr:hypothetical protein [Corynebacterium variabile]